MGRNSHACRTDRQYASWGYVKEGTFGGFEGYIRDYQGNVVGVVNTGLATRLLTQFTDYYPYGLPHGDATGVSVNRHKYGGKEYMTESGLNELDYGARHMLPQYCRFTSPDPLAADNRSVSAWSYCNGDPVNNIDPTGMSVIYRLNGDYIGYSSEGFNGEVVIYTGSESIDFSKLTQSEAFEKYPFDLFPFDSMRGSCPEPLSGEAMSKIWTHIISHFEGMQVYDEVFSIKKIEGEKIAYGSISHGYWETTHYPDNPELLPSIRGNGKYPYESTVENIASSIIVHEWYSHGVMHIDYRNHMRAYENVMGYNSFWDRTTNSYQIFNNDMISKILKINPQVKRR